MKDFIKWLGVNEKVAKVAVWLLIIMITLIIINSALASIGFPNYQITYENLVKIEVHALVNTLFSCILAILNFYALTLLVFRTKEAKRIFKYSLLYLLLNWIVSNIFDHGLLQVFIVIYLVTFCYFYANKNWKYILYGIIALIIDTLIQGTWYGIKVKLIDYTALGETTQALLSLDYFIIIGLIILVKEIYLKKRGENNE